MQILGFVHVGFGQGTVMGWTVRTDRVTEKAVLLRCNETGNTVWLPRSWFSPGPDGFEKEANGRAVDKMRAAGFRATSFHGDVV